MRKTGLFLILCLFLTRSVVVLADGRPPDEKIQRILVRLVEYRFEPTQIVLKAGTKIELTVDNEGTVLHEFVTEALKKLSVDVEVNGVVAETLGLEELEIPPKTKVILRFTAGNPGEFSISCHAEAPKDHFKEGMVGKLVIR